MLALVLVGWLPLLVLTTLAGTVAGGVRVPFIEHTSVHARLLGALPLLLIAELVAERRLSALVRQFTLQGLVPPEARARFDEAIRSSLRMARYAVPEAVLALVALTLGHWLWGAHVAMPVDTWYGRRTGQGLELTAAGTWYAFASLPLYRFLLYRWYFRIGLWYRLLWKLSRLPLNLNPAHPDRAAGLGFLGQSLVAFAPLLIAHTVMVAGLVGDQIWHRGAALTDFRTEIGLVLVLLLLIGLVPLFFFAGPLSRARRASLREHAVFAARYVDEFTRRWLGPSDAPRPSPLGSPDLQSMADLGTHYQSVRETRLVPVSKRMLVQLGGLLMLPFAPLLLTIMPLEELVGRLAKLVL